MSQWCPWQASGGMRLSDRAVKSPTVGEVNIAEEESSKVSWMKCVGTCAQTVPKADGEG